MAISHEFVNSAGPGGDTGPLFSGLGRGFEEAGVAQIWTTLSLCVVLGTGPSCCAGPLSPALPTQPQPFLCHHFFHHPWGNTFWERFPPSIRGVIFKILSNLPSITLCPHKNPVTSVEMFCPHVTHEKTEAQRWGESCSSCWPGWGSALYLSPRGPTRSRVQTPSLCHSFTRPCVHSFIPQPPSNQGSLWTHLPLS